MTPELSAEYARKAELWVRRAVIPREADMKAIVRWEAHNNRQLYRALWELRLMKKARREAEQRDEAGRVWVEVRKERQVGDD